MQNSEEIKRWAKALLIGAVFFGLFAAYLYLRRGSFSLSTANKVLGSSAVFLAGFTLLISPLKAQFAVLNKFMTIRRHMGLVAFGAAAIHIIISIFFIPQRFNLEWYLREWFGVAFGVVAILIWLYLTYISRNSQIMALGADKWKKYQSLGGRIAFWLVFIHVVALKYNDWLSYFQGKTQASSFLKNPAYPPESFFIFLILVGILLYRLGYDWRKKNAKKL